VRHPTMVTCDLAVRIKRAVARRWIEGEKRRSHQEKIDSASFPSTRNVHDPVAGRRADLQSNTGRSRACAMAECNSAPHRWKNVDDGSVAGRRADLQSAKVRPACAIEDTGPRTPLSSAGSR
jgi:hypothetical protein